MRHLLTLAAVGLLMTGCATTPPSVPSPTPTPSAESYGDCVKQITMDPDKVQEYIDAVKAECGEPPR